MITEVIVERITQSHVRLLVQKHNTLNNTFPVTALVMSNEEVLQIINALQQSVQPTVATESLEDSPWETGARRGAVILPTRNSG